MNRHKLLHGCWGIAAPLVITMAGGSLAQDGRLVVRPGFVSPANPTVRSTNVGGTNCAQTLESAKAAFKQGDFDEAAHLVNQGLTQCPGDASFTEFRGLVLFAKGEYRESAAEIRKIMASGTGWDWPTVYRLYPSLEAYTTHLRALETYTRKHPDDTAARFLQAYHYKVGGYPKAAVRELEMVVRFEYNDPLAVALLRKLSERAR